MLRTCHAGRRSCKSGTFKGSVWWNQKEDLRWWWLVAGLMNLYNSTLSRFAICSKPSSSGLLKKGWSGWRWKKFVEIRAGHCVSFEFYSLNLNWGNSHGRFKHVPSQQLIYSLALKSLEYDLHKYIDYIVNYFYPASNKLANETCMFQNLPKFLFPKSPVLHL